MGVLKIDRAHWTTHLLLAATLAAAAGCVLFSEQPAADLPPAFNHAVHVQASVECADCHAGAESSDEPGMPTQAQCKLCHQGIDAGKPPEKQASVLFVEGGIRTSHVSQLGPEVVFSHASHVGRGQECGSCHKAIEQSTRIDAGVRVDMDACTACHASKGAKNDCATCHREIRATTAPESHAQAWTKLHGQAVRWPGGEMADRCSLCHTESKCTTCHMEQAPESHNNFWRIKGHGVAAEMDRQGCAVCHRSDSCQRCHADTPPLSHTGSFGAPLDTHCASCHFPLSDNGCIVCHKGTPSHALATPLPASHNPGMNCRQCHGVTQPLPHVDNGSSCTMCHH
jgi:hypothetical protein